MSSYPFVPVSNIFNPLDYTELNDALTLETADRRYLSLGGGNVTGYTVFNSGINLNGPLSISGTVVSLTGLQYLDSIIPGGAQASKAMILNSEKDISGIRNMYANSMTCASSLAAPSITMDNMNFNTTFVDGIVTSSGQNKLMMIDNNRAFGPLTFNADNTLSLSNDLKMLSTGTIPVLKIGRADTNVNCYQISYVHVGDGNVLNRLTISHKGATANETLTFTANGRVGIGSPTPTQKFEINGNMNVSNGSYYMGGGMNLMTNVPGGLNGCRLADAAGLGSEFYTSSTLRYGGFAGFNLGITNAIWTGYGIGETPFIGLNDDCINMGSAGDAGAIIYGDEDAPTTGFTISMSGSISTFSDRRLKRQIEPHVWDNVLDKIASVEVVKYKRKRPDGLKRITNKYDKIEYGVIAQDFRKQFKEFVKKGLKGEDIVDGDTMENDYFFLDKTSMYLPLFQAVKELYERIKQLENK